MYRKSYDVLFSDPDGNQTFKRTDYLWKRSEKERKKKKEMKQNLSNRVDNSVQVLTWMSWYRDRQVNDIRLSQAQR